MSFWEKWVATVVLVVWAVLVSCPLWGQGLDASLEGAARRFASEERRISGQLSRSAAPNLPTTIPAVCDASYCPARLFHVPSKSAPWLHQPAPRTESIDILGDLPNTYGRGSGRFSSTIGYPG
ncbi:hypothetical protein Psta_0677 [Pirellula staleyi DSM 6068]|uniref:Uncharacterized protein n=1 Tax=Pirellula staleyi (strain ATCC 27377 / DSM 6068 / ICPB 4128) TaxID=530564 RepID=D2R5A4_PIRSD|nr:hypothetical protein Psta_0677 [Pirellula staleyi DSM 6068]